MSYYGQPILKQPVWTWEIPCYFFAGGLAGASAGLAYAAELRGNAPLAKRAWVTSLLAVSASPPLLISDLGRPERFLNMMRMFKITSPMSVGSWVLAGSGTSTALATFGLFPRASKPAAALLGLPLSTYTAALVADTAIPVWHQSRKQLPFVFGAGAAMSAGAAALISTPTEHARPARRLALAGAAAELLATEAMRHEHLKLPPASTFARASKAAIAAGAGLLVSGRPRTAGMLMLAGAMCTRWSVYKAGFISAAKV
jgi:formate-dependent nitrite reductase membrane component NrfD